MEHDGLTVIDLFAGVGGLSLGFVQNGFEILYANEFDAQIAEAYSLNHPSTKTTTEDIRNLKIEREFSRYASKVTVVVGGPPCQGFSQKGHRKTIHDERNFLFRKYVEVVKVVKPKYLVMENVPNLLTNENGLFKNEIFSLFSELGYSCSASVLNAADFGVPQNRRRAIILGKLGEEGLDIPDGLSMNTTVWDAIGDLAFLESGEGAQEQRYQLTPVSWYQKELRGSEDVLRNHVATKHTKLALERLELIPANCTQKVLPKEHRTKSVYSGTWTRLNSKGKAPTITTRFDTPSSGQFTHPYLNRAITVREAARLQSFPDSYRFVGPKSSQMKQVGNAVPPKLAYHVAKAVKEDLERGDEGTGHHSGERRTRSEN